MWDQLAEVITQSTGTTFVMHERRSVSGGNINHSYQISDGVQRYFVKVNQAQHLGMFEGEWAGLLEMHRTQTIRVPQPVALGIIGAHAYLILEWLDLSGMGCWQQLGEQLAALHRVLGPAHGWHRDNTIGSTTQPNRWIKDWRTFWGEYRLGYQLDLACQQGFDRRLSQLLLDQLPQLLAGHNPAPALVHGDLWGGNAAFTPTGEPVLFDPALYYGDREVDLAMTELFGGFPQEFYAAYNCAYPIDPGYKQRKVLYNLYHVLNHYHLFRGGYGDQAEQMIQLLLRSR